MKYSKILISVFFTFTALSCGNKPVVERGEWKSLFNGKDINDWIVKFHHHDLGDNYANTFRVKEGVLQVNYDSYNKFNGRFGHLFYKKPFSSFHLKFKYRFKDQWMKDAPPYTYRNSGVMYHSQNPRTILKNQDWPISLEYQILAEMDGLTSRPTGNVCSPGTDILYKGKKASEHCIRSSSETYKWNQWITAEVIVYADSLLIHKVNGIKVLEFSKPKIGGGVVNGADTNIKIDGTPLKKGFIGFQAEGQGIEFKDIIIKEL